VIVETIHFLNGQKMNIKRKIRAFDGGNSRWYDEFLKNAETGKD
jgi:hypothetical protein